MQTDDAELMTVGLVLTPDPEIDDEAADRLTRRLVAEISELDVDRIERVGPGELPSGAKAADPVTIGAIIVALGASGGVFTAMIETIRSWIERQSGRHRIAITIDGDSIELDRASDEERRRIVEAFLRRHTGGGQD
ncbi:hypothetical protein [Actinoplanes sp. L3-i22]|uniref:effector-associated constant component EACC1 n=1 Tax=Actinoplanes sp. L3-i22 TaxID=2836373 RepID=UPI001C74CB53|nr:hypothetical protein [Actinoplanes sp. L3-i22]BCY10790.1 hypothetical protein L3i22_058780 [Actinoplanes sp. L3-i22]